MPMWVKCTTTKGELLYANIENAVTMSQRGLRKETVIHFLGQTEPVEVRETPEDLIASSALSRANRRTD